MISDNILLRPHIPGEEDLNPPPDQSILPNAMLNHSDILELVINIRNVSLRTEMLTKQDLNYIAADIIFNIEAIWGKTFNVGEFVILKVDLLAKTDRTFQIQQIQNDPIWLIVNETSNANKELCRIESNRVVHKLNVTTETLFNLAKTINTTGDSMKRILEEKFRTKEEYQQKGGESLDNSGYQSQNSNENDEVIENNPTLHYQKQEIPTIVNDVPNIPDEKLNQNQEVIEKPVLTKESENKQQETETVDTQTNKGNKIKLDEILAIDYQSNAKENTVNESWQENNKPSLHDEDLNKTREETNKLVDTKENVKRQQEIKENEVANIQGQTESITNNVDEIESIKDKQKNQNKEEDNETIENRGNKIDKSQQNPNDIQTNSDNKHLKRMIREEKAEHTMTSTIKTTTLNQLDLIPVCE